MKQENRRVTAGIPVLQGGEDVKEFYRSALGAVEIYREMLRAYALLRPAGLRPQRGDLERVRQDTHAHVAERGECIQAVCDFHGEFSAMLAVLPSREA